MEFPWFRFVADAPKEYFHMFPYSHSQCKDEHCNRTPPFSYSFTSEESYFTGIPGCLTDDGLYTKEVGPSLRRYRKGGFFVSDVTVYFPPWIRVKKVQDTVGDSVTSTL